MSVGEIKIIREYNNDTLFEKIKRFILYSNKINIVRDTNSKNIKE